MRLAVEDFGIAVIQIIFAISMIGMFWTVIEIL